MGVIKNPVIHSLITFLRVHTGARLDGAGFELRGTESVDEFFRVGGSVLALPVQMKGNLEELIEWVLARKMVWRYEPQIIFGGYFTAPNGTVFYLAPAGGPVWKI